MSDAQPPFRVLDLACGSGQLRAVVAERVLTRRVRYTGIDTQRWRLQPLRPHPVSAARSTGATSKPPADAPQSRLEERFVRAELDLQHPEKLIAQLDAIVGRERFDEIHVHLLHPGKHGFQANGAFVLRAVGRFLRPGGRIYHLFQTSSPFFDFKPIRGRPPKRVSWAPGPDGDVIEWNEERFREGARKGGLVLDKCGQRYDSSRSSGPRAPWVTRRFDGPEPDRRTAETYERLARRYSGFAGFASHFVILRKKRRKKPAPRPRRKSR